MDSQITLKDGRKLGYSEFGDPEGYPVVNCHGGLVGRLDAAPADETARKLRLRLISADRPGIGLSDPKPGRKTLDWADDVRELVEQLGIERFCVMGWSMGGQYALAVAHGLEARVVRTAIIAGALPLDDAKTLPELNRMDRRLTELAQTHPDEAELAFKAMGEIASLTPQLWNEMTVRGLCAADAQAVLSLPEPGLAGIAAPALKSSAGMVAEYRAWVKPWGFTPQQIRVPVILWQGDCDTLVPPHWAEELARRIPTTQSNLLKDEGHFLAYKHYPEILSQLVS